MAELERPLWRTARPFQQEERPARVVAGAGQTSPPASWIAAPAIADSANLPRLHGEQPKMAETGAGSESDL
jgi:hypothetical protein